MPLLPTAVRRRIPVRVRQYWKLLAGCVAFVAVTGLVLGTVRVRPYVTSGSDTRAEDVTFDIAGTRDLFDPAVPHTMTLTFPADRYQRMLDGFLDGGDKGWVEADLMVDGTALPGIGIRLKGNSTLRGLVNNAPSAAGGPAQPGGFGGRPTLRVTEPETLPWLIRFDQFVDGRRYQGHREIAVRVGGMGTGPTVLNEALSLDLLASAGEVAPRYGYTSFTVNDRPTIARLVVEHPGEQFAQRLGDSGVLYKALAGGQFTDRGADPIAYSADFDQVTMKGSQDLQPVIDLIRWVHAATDAEFDADLGRRVDVASFARYAAMQNLLLNFDDMAGPGRNFYLWYDLHAKRFTVIGWDYNLTFLGSATQGPHDAVGGGPRGGGGGRLGGNRLKERFLASAAFRPVYEQAYRTLYKELFASGRALAAVDRISGVLSRVSGVDPQRVSSDTSQLRSMVRRRTEALARNEVVTGSP